MELQELAAANQQRLTNLAKQGVILDPAMLLKLRVDKLTELLFGIIGQLTGKGTELWEAFDLDWEQTMSEICDEAESSLARKLLTDGVR